MGYGLLLLIIYLLWYWTLLFPLTVFFDDRVLPNPRTAPASKMEDIFDNTGTCNSAGGAGKRSAERDSHGQPEKRQRHANSWLIWSRRGKCRARRSARLQFKLHHRCTRGIGEASSIAPTTWFRLRSACSQPEVTQHGDSFDIYIISVNQNQHPDQNETDYNIYVKHFSLLKYLNHSTKPLDPTVTR